MAKSMQEFLADATQIAAPELVKAYLSLPEDERNWSPSENSRTALDMVTECALLSGYTADTIRAKEMPAGAMEGYVQAKEELKEQGWEKIHALLEANVAKAAEVIRATPDSDLTVEVPMPWGPMTLAHMITYPHWNMVYHEGQIYYIASVLGCLK